MKIIVFTKSAGRLGKIRDAIIEAIAEDNLCVSDLNYDEENDFYWGQPAFEDEVICFMFTHDEVSHPGTEVIKKSIKDKLSFSDKQFITIHQF